MSQIFGMVSLDESTLMPSWVEKMKESLPSHHSFSCDVVFEKDFFVGYHGNKNTYISTQKNMIISNSNYLVCGDVQLYNLSDVCLKLNIDVHEDHQIKVILRAFERWGEKCTDHFNGDFSFFVYDLKQNSCWLFRDHLGVRPVFYYKDNSYFAFASDIRPLLSLQLSDMHLNDKKVYSTLNFVYHIDTEITDFKSIYKLPAAHYMNVSKTTMIKKKYWQPKISKIRFKTEDEYINEFRNLIIDAVKIRMPQSSNIGTELSGGLDSSVISILLAKYKNTNQNISAFSWSPDYETQFRVDNDERDLIKKVCEQENIQCHYYKETEDWKNYSFNTYIQAGEWVFQHYQSLMDSGTPFLFTGWGGDQASSYRHTPFSLISHGEIIAFIRELRIRSKGSWKSFLKLLHVYTWKAIFSDPFMYGKKQIKHSSLLKVEFIKKWQDKVKQDIVYVPVNPAKHIESGDIQTRTEYTAWLGSHFNLKVLYPLLDKRVIEFSLAIPRSMFIKNGTSRYLFRKAFESILPEEIFKITNKDDPARTAYSNTTLESRIITLKTQVEHLDRQLFKDYVDFDVLENLMQKLLESYDMNLYVHLFYSLKYVAEVQKTLEDSRINSKNLKST
jgi:asparagine synthase (glutamine-hydrolysing)